MHFENTGQRDYKGIHNPVNDIQTKIIKPDRTKDNIFRNRKMTERMASGWRPFGGWIQELKAIRKDAVKMVEATYNLGAISPRKAKKMQSRRWKEAYEELQRKCMAKRISFPQRST